MGPPPRSLTAEANSCFMVRVLHGPNRIQGCGASIAPERGLPSDQLYRTSNNEGHRVAVTLDTKVLIQGCGASIAPERGLPSDQLYRRQKRKSSMRAHVFRFAPETGHRGIRSACPFCADTVAKVFLG